LDAFLDDIDRIEVIRGPGGSLWGANAINGVVNVITKPAEDTQGGLVSIGGGTEDRVSTAARYGVALDKDVFLRFYGKYFDRDDAAAGTNPDQRAFDGWHMSRGGFRT